MSEKVISSTTQEFLDVYDIVNNTILLKDGSAAIVLQVGTMNFSLLAEQEQDAIIFTYGSLLNSLNYPIQISIQSQTKDVTKYLRLLDEQIQKASSDRKASLIKQYRNFVAALIRERNVLEKRFYVTVPATPGEMGLITPSNVLPGKTEFNIASVEKSIILEKAANLLEPRRDHLIAQFNRLGLYTRQLNTQEIIQNFYINYNPEAAEGQEISNNENYTTPLVRASFGGKIMQTNSPDNNSMNTMSTTPTLENGSVSKPNPTPEEILSGAPAETVTVPLTNASLNVSSPAEAPTQVEMPTQVEAPTQVATPTQVEEPALPEIAAPTGMPPQNEVSPQINQVEVPTQTNPIIPTTNTSDIPNTNVELPTSDLNNTAGDTGNTVDLSLNADLIKNNNEVPTQQNEIPFSQSEPTTSQAPPIVEPTLQVAEPTTPVIEENNFAEEIAPLQGQLNQQNEPLQSNLPNLQAQIEPKPEEKVEQPQT